MAEHLESDAPLPSQGSLTAMLSTIRRVREINSGMARGESLGTEVLLDTGDPSAIARFDELEAPKRAAKKGAGGPGASRRALDAAYREPHQRALVLFAWLGSSDGSWCMPRIYEAVPESLLWSIRRPLWPLRSPRIR
jgi:hypothetical protein